MRAVMPPVAVDIPRTVRRRTLVLAMALAAVPAAEAGAHPQSTLDPASDSSREITDLWWFMLIAATVVVAVVTALALLAVLRRQGRLGDRVARRLSGMRTVALGGVVFPLIVLAVLFAWTLETLVETAPGSEDPELTIEVTGRQWFWDVRYPGAEEAITANEIHVPVGVPVEIEVRTEDVLHSFWVPRLNRKIDLVPGEVNRITFTASERGVYRGQCAEYCGTQHGNMAFLVIADDHERFDSWLASISQPAIEPTNPDRRRGQEVFLDQGCGDCHTIRGTPAAGEAGPDLTHLAARRMLAGATIPNTRGDLGGWILDPQGIKPGNKMPGFDIGGEDLQHLLDYLEGLR